MIDVQAELRALAGGTVWDREGDCDYVEGERWMMDFIKRIRKDAFDALKDARKKHKVGLICEGCYESAACDPWPEGWFQFGRLLLNKGELAAWCPKCKAASLAA